MCWAKNTLTIGNSCPTKYVTSSGRSIMKYAFLPFFVSLSGWLLLHSQCSKWFSWWNKYFKVGCFLCVIQRQNTVMIIIHSQTKRTFECQFWPSLYLYSLYDFEAKKPISWPQFMTHFGSTLNSIIAEAAKRGLVCLMASVKRFA